MERSNFRTKIYRIKYRLAGTEGILLVVIVIHLFYNVSTFV